MKIWQFTFILALILILGSVFLLFACEENNTSGDNDVDSDDDATDDDSNDDDDSALPPGWMEMESGTEAWLFDIIGFNANSVYAVGGIWGYEDEYTIDEAFLLKYNGESWERILTGFEDNYFFYEISGFSEDNIFIRGVNDLDSQFIIIHFNGQSWSELPFPPITLQPDEELSLSNIVVSSENDLYTIGTVRENYQERAKYLFRYYGATWSEPIEVNCYLTSLWSTPDSEIFGFGTVNLGYSETCGVHYDGNSFSSIEMIFDLTDYEKRLLYHWDGWGISKNSVFAISNYADESENTYPFIAHYNGSECTGLDLNLDLASVPWFTAIWGTKSTNIYVGARFNSEDYIGDSFWPTYLIFKYDGSNWKEFKRGPSTPVEGDIIQGIWGTSDNNIFFIGGNGLILHYGGPEK